MPSRSKVLLLVAVLFGTVGLSCAMSPGKPSRANKKDESSTSSESRFASEAAQCYIYSAYVTPLPNQGAPRRRVARSARACRVAPCRIRPPWSPPCFDGAISRR